MAFYNSFYSIPYLVVFSLLFIMSIKVLPADNIKTISSINTVIIYAICLLMIIFIGFRGFIYTDWHAYYRVFDQTPTFFSSEEEIDLFYRNNAEWNKGYLVYSILCKTIFRTYTLFQAFSFIIDFIILNSVFSRYFKNPQMKVMAFAFFFIFGGVLGFGIEINLMRNAKAIMLFLISLKYLEEKRFLPFLLLNILGFYFHSISIILIFTYFFLRKRIPKYCLIVIFFFGNVVYLLHIEWLKNLLLLLNQTIKTPLYTMIDVYLRSKKYGSEWGLSIGFLERTFSFFLVLFMENKLIEKNKSNIIIINSFYVFIFIYLYCSEMSIILNRVGLLFIYGYWILFPQIYELLSKNYKKFFLIVFFLYGVLKCLTCNNILYYYENFLVPHLDYDQRWNYNSAFTRMLDNKIK